MFSVVWWCAGVVEGMVGMSVGDERAITTEVGDTWWEPDTLRGVEIRADIKLKELFEWELPEVRARGSLLSVRGQAHFEVVSQFLGHLDWGPCRCAPHLLGDTYKILRSGRITQYDRRADHQLV